MILRLPGGYGTHPPHFLILARSPRRSMSAQVQESMPFPETQQSTSYYAEPRNVNPGEQRTLNGVTTTVRNDWTREEITEIYNTPMLELLYQAATVHRTFFNPKEVQQCTLVSIKTGGCTEDCSYCSQSSKYKTFVKPTPQMKVEEVLAAARRAKEAGSTRFCMGAAWRELGNKKNAFKHILEMVKGANSMGMEVCCTLGMLNAEQAKQLKEAGLTAYNHNLDTSREFYPSVISSRSYEERLATISHVREAGISVCCGGILGLGEGQQDRVGLLQTIATLDQHPESVPINALVPVDGTPLGDNKEATGAGVPTAWDMARMIATARIVMPKTMVRLSAGRMSFSESEQALMFMAGANSIFAGDKLLTTPNPEFNEDQVLFDKLGLVGKPAHSAPLESPYAASLGMANKPEAMREAGHSVATIAAAMEAEQVMVTHHRASA
ncbi:unnamed protein product [Chrysoparadoxa australica]